MSSTVPLSKLDAVNAMLFDIGERPVNTLGTSARLDVVRSESTLDQITRRTLLEDWWFNTETITLTVDGSGYYNLSQDIGRAKFISGGPTTGTRGRPTFVVRGSKLYDTLNATDVFIDAPVVTLEIHRLLDFADLPQSVREYVYATASLRNESRGFGSPTVAAELREQAASAFALMNEEDCDAREINQTWSPHFLQLMHNR